MRMLRYLAPVAMVMLPMVSLMLKLLDVGNHMLDWPANTNAQTRAH